MEGVWGSDPRTAKIIEQPSDVGQKRISEMDVAGIDVQVLSLTAPGVEQLEEDEQVALSTEANDFIAAATRHNPTRFAGFATLPPIYIYIITLMMIVKSGIQRK
jgi:predicted TIM-barrel fold metal-dependent hydrolase